MAQKYCETEECERTSKQAIMTAFVERLRLCFNVQFADPLPSSKT